MDKLTRELFSPKGERTLLKSKEFIRKYLYARERIACLSDYGRVCASIAEEAKISTSSIIS